MATPQSPSSDAGGKKPEHEQVTFRFCSECSNMLYPKEDEEMHKLQFTCRTCFYTEDAQTTCVFRNVLNTSAGETAGVTQDVGSDPTVSGPFACNAPAHGEDDGCKATCCLMCGTVIACQTCGGTMDVDLVRKTSRNNLSTQREAPQMNLDRMDEQKLRRASAQTLDELLAASETPLGFDENAFDNMEIDEFDDEYDAYHSETSSLFGDISGMAVKL